VNSTVLISAGITVLVSAISAGSAYLIARRTTRGTVDTSEAATLWAESQAMRRELREEVVQLRAEAATLRQEISELHGDVAGLKAEVVELRQLLLAKEARGG